MFEQFYFKAKTEKLKPLEVELRRLEDLSDAIVNGTQSFKLISNKVTIIWVTLNSISKVEFYAM